MNYNNKNKKLINHWIYNILQIFHKTKNKNESLSLNNIYLCRQYAIMQYQK